MKLTQAILRQQREAAMKTTPTIQLAAFAKQLRYQRNASAFFHDLFMEELTDRAEKARKEIGV